MAVALTALAASPALAPPVGPAAAVAAALAFVAAFSVGAGPVAWVYSAEALPPDLRDRGGAAAVCVAWLANLAIGSTCPWLLVSVF
jgi:MFS transporter, SP family, galactose:H+ symporter